MPAAVQYLQFIDDLVIVLDGEAHQRVRIVVELATGRWWLMSYSSAVVSRSALNQ
jgi:hypothetical protein